MVFPAPCDDMVAYYARSFTRLLEARDPMAELIYIQSRFDDSLSSEQHFLLAKLWQHEKQMLLDN